MDGFNGTLCHLVLSPFLSMEIRHIAWVAMNFRIRPEERPDFSLTICDGKNILVRIIKDVIAIGLHNGQGSRRRTHNKFNCGADISLFAAERKFSPMLLKMARGVAIRSRIPCFGPYLAPYWRSRRWSNRLNRWQRCSHFRRQLNIQINEAGAVPQPQKLPTEKHRQREQHGKTPH